MLSVFLAGCYAGLDGGAGSGTSPGATESAGDSDGHEDDGTAPGREPEDAPELATRGGLRRLTVVEYDNTLRDLLLDDSKPAAEFWPADTLTPFDNDYIGQEPTEALVLGVEKLAIEAGDRLVEDSERLAAVVGCEPAGVDDTACFRSFIATFGRRAFRRPLTDAEVDGFAELLAIGQDAGRWNAAVAAAVSAMLQDPNFLYRVEIGAPVDGDPQTVRLTDWEVASRLSYFLWSTMPDDDLLDHAAEGGLSSAEDVRAQAERMLQDERAVASLGRFHALWLGYSRLGTGGLSADMRAETEALLHRVVFEQDAPWASLFTAEETFVSAALAEHYDLEAPDGEAGWVSYREDGRGGIVSHGALLSLGNKFGDTSPTVRGVEIRARLFCETVEIPENLNVNTDDPPGVDPDDCKIDRYEAHRSDALCAGCHGLLDGIGFGLEAYDATGAFRTHDAGKPDCEVSGDGELLPEGTFNGPGELGLLLSESEAVRECSIRQVLRFASGKAELDDLDEVFLEALLHSAGDKPPTLGDILVELASADAFRFRTIKEED